MGQLLVMPIFTGFVMPLAVIGLALMPLRLDWVCWWAAGKGLELILWMTGKIAALPGAVSDIPQWPVTGFLSTVVGMIVLCLLRAPWRLAGIGLILSGWAIASVTPRPQLYIAENAANVGALTADDQGGLSIVSRRRERFTVEQWMREIGMNTAIRDLPKFGECKEPICRVTLRTGHSVAYTEDIASTATACQLRISSWRGCGRRARCHKPAKPSISAREGFPELGLSASALRGTGSLFDPWPPSADNGPGSLDGSSVRR